MPWQTYTHHPLVFTSLGSQSPSYSLRSFVEAFVEAVNKILAGNGQGVSWSCSSLSSYILLLCDLLYRLVVQVSLRPFTSHSL